MRIYGSWTEYIVIVAKAGDRLYMKWLNHSALQLSEENSVSN